MKNFNYLLLFIVAGCSSVTVSYDYDKATDFTKYHTYGFTDGTKNFNISELTRNKILAAIDNEMTSRGYTKSDNPDVMVDLYGKLEQKQSATATTTGTGMYRPWGYGYGGGFTTTHIDVDQYTEGTLFINIVDNAQQKLVWQGRGTKTLNESSSPQKREANINSAIASIYKKYPIQPPSKK